MVNNITIYRFLGLKAYNTSFPFLLMRSYTPGLLLVLLCAE